LTPTGIQRTKVQAEHRRSVADQLRTHGTNAKTFSEYVEQAVENTCSTDVNLIGQAVGSESFIILTQIALSHGYDSYGSSYSQLETLLDSMRAYSRRVDLSFSYGVHSERQTTFQNITVQEFLDIRRRERNAQDRYPLPLVGWQLMELIPVLDDSYGHIKHKFSSLKPEEVNSRTILDAEYEILKLSRPRKTHG
jgi:hypothetical protein